MKSSNLFLAALLVGSVVAVPVQAADEPEPKDPVMACEDEAAEAGIPDQEFDAYVAQCVERMEQQRGSEGDGGGKKSDS